MKYEILLSIFSLIITIFLTWVAWYICDCPKLHSDVDQFLLALIEITLYNAIEAQLARKDE